MFYTHGESLSLALQNEAIICMPKRKISGLSVQIRPDMPAQYRDCP